MMLRVWSSLAVLLTLCVLSAPAEAQRRYRSVLNITGYVNFVSDYFYRGTSRTNGQQTVQGDIGINFALYGSLRIGGWGSGIVGASSELRRYARFSVPVSPVLRVNTGIIRYSFPGTQFENNVNIAGVGRRAVTSDSSGPDLDEAFTGITASLALLSLDINYYEPVDNLDDSESYSLVMLRLPFGVWASRGGNDDLRVGYRFRFNKLTLGVTIHENDDSITSSEIDNIWRSLRANNYEGDEVVFNLQADF